MNLKELKYTYFEENKKYDFIFPIWATEQHGPFIPFWTDTYIVDYLTQEVWKQIPELIILPTLEFSRSQEHKWFYWTIYLSEETLKLIMFDICNSLKDKAKNIFIISHHFNDPYIESFIKNNTFFWVNIIHIDIVDNEDDEYIEKNILNWEIDWHAWNSEISNMLFIDEKLVKIPDENYPKIKLDDPFWTDNLIEKSLNWIVDNNPKWLTNKDIWKKILDIYVTRIIKNLKKYVVIK